jgi:hypothetical protein
MRLYGCAEIARFRGYGCSVVMERLAGKALAGGGRRVESNPRRSGGMADAADSKFKASDFLSVCICIANRGY